MTNMNLNTYNAEWTGKWPNLCHGEWKLYFGDQELNIPIPFLCEPAETLNTYSRWYFDDDWCDCWDSYEDGLPFEQWADKYKEWLTAWFETREWQSVYEAFQREDWRYCSCGGCI